jgi:hypothetical protein
MDRLRARLSYANVMATVAVFIALGGTSYAVTSLPKNSVGSKQIRARAVGSSDLATGSVRSKQLRDRTIGVRDVSLAARQSLRGQRGETGPKGPVGPSGVTLSAAVDAAGGVARSHGAGPRADHPTSSSGNYVVPFNQNLDNCYAVASLSRVAGATPDDPQSGEIVTAINGSNVTVRTRNSAGQPTDLPFHLIVVC